MARDGGIDLYVRIGDVSKATEVVWKVGAAWQEERKADSNNMGVGGGCRNGPCDVPDVYFYSFCKYD